MFGVLIYDVLFFATPIILIALFGVALYRYMSANKQNKVSPGTFSDDEIKKRKSMLISLSIISGILIAIVIGFCALMFLAVAFM